MMGLLFLKTIAINTKLSYSKSERLKSRKLIEHLFSKGRSLSVFPLKVFYDLLPGAERPLQAGVTTSSRHFKKAVQRNRVKRVLREVYRLQKTPLEQVLAAENKSVILFFIFTGKELPVFSELHEKMKVVLQRVQDKVLNNQEKN
jgi:ribonuclease P protein component